MNTPNPIRDKSYTFAIAIVQACKQLKVSTEFSILRQVLRSGTSIGANVEEALQGQSKKDFIAKLSISLKEASETRYWLRLILDTSERKNPLLPSLIAQCEELIKLLTSILRTSKSQK